MSDEEDNQDETSEASSTASAVNRALARSLFGDDGQLRASAVRPRAFSDDRFSNIQRLMGGAGSQPTTVITPADPTPIPTQQPESRVGISEDIDTVPSQNINTGESQMSLSRALGTRTARQRRRRGPTETITITQNVSLAPGDPRLNALEREAEDNVAEAARQAHLRSAKAHGEEAQVFSDIASFMENDREVYSDLVNRQMNTARATLEQLNSLNNAVMNRQIDPTRFFSSRGAASGFAAASSVALGVLGQALAPGTENAALNIIRRAIDRDIEAQVQDMQNARAGVAMARNLYSDLVSLFGDERAARSALQSMYLAEAEAQIESIRSNSASAADRGAADAVLHQLALERASREAETARQNSRQHLSRTISATVRPGNSRMVNRMVLSQRRATAAMQRAGVLDAYQRLGIEPPEDLRPTPREEAAAPPSTAATPRESRPNTPRATSSQSTGRTVPAGDRPSTLSGFSRVEHASEGLLYGRVLSTEATTGESGETPVTQAQVVYLAPGATPGTVQVRLADGSIASVNPSESPRIPAGATPLYLSPGGPSARPHVYVTDYQLPRRGAQIAESLGEVYSLGHYHLDPRAITEISGRYSPEQNAAHREDLRKMLTARGALARIASLIPRSYATWENEYTQGQRDSASQDLLEQFVQIYDLGVMNGNDQERLERIVPTARATGNFFSSDTVQQVRGMIPETRRIILQRLRANPYFSALRRTESRADRINAANRNVVSTGR